MTHVSARYVCRHGKVEPEVDTGNPWCVECECAPFLDEPDVREVRKALEGWVPPTPPSVARDHMAMEVAARRKAERKADELRAELAELRVRLDEALAT